MASACRPPSRTPRSGPWYVLGVRSHDGRRAVAVSARSDAAADHDGAGSLSTELHRGPPGAGGSPGGWPRRVARSRIQGSPPVGVGSPRGALETQPGGEGPRQLGVRPRSTSAGRLPLGRLEQVECGEIRQIQAFVEIRVVSMPPSVRNSRPLRCGRLSRYVAISPPPTQARRLLTNAAEDNSQFPTSLRRVFRSSEEFVRNRIGLLLKPGLSGIKALVKIPPQRSGVPHRSDEHRGDEREQGKAEAQGDEPGHVAFRHRE